MSDYTEALKFLNLTPARVATLQEAQNNPLPFDKYYGLLKARDIKKINTVITLSAFSGIQSNYAGQLVFQYNFTAPKSFCIINPVAFLETPIKFITVKFRIGTTVYRYLIAGSQKNLTGDIDVHTFEKYTAQSIPPNCCFEVWSTVGGLFMNLLSDYKITISILTNPPTPDQTEITLQPSIPITKTTLGIVYPTVLPYNQPDIIWNDN